MKRFGFLSGLPRTGSTLLTTLLSQHPDICTTSSVLTRNIMVSTLTYTMGDSLCFDRKDAASPIWGIERGIFYGVHEKIESNFVLCKDRGWASEIEMLQRVLGHSPQIVATVRNIPEILSSFILLSQNPKSRIAGEVLSEGREVTPWSLSRMIWERYIYPDWRAFKGGWESYPERFLILDYDNLVSSPVESVRSVYSYFGLSPRDPVTDGLVNPHAEDDWVFGIPNLHHIRPSLKKVSPPSEEVLGEDCYEFWKSRKLEFWERG